MMSSIFLLLILFALSRNFYKEPAIEWNEFTENPNTPELAATFAKSKLLNTLNCYAMPSNQFGNYILFYQIHYTLFSPIYTCTYF